MIRTNYDLARAIVQREIDFDRCAKSEKEIKKLMKIRGIGSWPAYYITMWAMECPDAFLETNVVVKEFYTSKALSKMAEVWQPWRRYATINLWNTS